jgi:hypothetical protein
VKTQTWRNNRYFSRLVRTHLKCTELKCSRVSRWGVNSAIKRYNLLLHSMWAEICIKLILGSLQNEHLTHGDWWKRMETYVFDSIYFLCDIRSGIRDPHARCQSHSYTFEFTISSKDPRILNLDTRWRVANLLQRPAALPSERVRTYWTASWLSPGADLQGVLGGGGGAGRHANWTQVIRRPAHSLATMSEQSWLHILDRMGGEVWIFSGMWTK